MSFIFTFKYDSKNKEWSVQSEEEVEDMSLSAMMELENKTMSISKELARKGTRLRLPKEVSTVIKNKYQEFGYITNNSVMELVEKYDMAYKTVITYIRNFIYSPLGKKYSPCLLRGIHLKLNEQFKQIDYKDFPSGLAHVIASKHNITVDKIFNAWYLYQFKHGNLKD